MGKCLRFKGEVRGARGEVRSSNYELRRVEVISHAKSAKSAESLAIKYHACAGGCRKLRYDKRAQRFEGRGSNYEGRRAKFEVRSSNYEGLNVYCFHLVLGDVGGGKGNDSRDGDNDTGLGVDACHTAYNAFEGAVGDADRTTGTVVYLGIGDRI